VTEVLDTEDEEEEEEADEDDNEEEEEEDDENVFECLNLLRIVSSIITSLSLIDDDKREFLSLDGILTVTQSTSPSFSFLSLSP